MGVAKGCRGNVSGEVLSSFISPLVLCSWTQLFETSDQVAVWKKDKVVPVWCSLSGVEGIQSEFCPGYFLGDLLSSPGIVVSSRAVSQGVMVAVVDRWIWSRELAEEHGRGATRRKGNPRNAVARDSGEDRGKPPIPQGHSSSVRLVDFTEKQTNMISAIARRPKDILHPPGVPTENTRSCSGTFCGSKSSSEEFKIVFP